MSLKEKEVSREVKKIHSILKPRQLIETKVAEILEVMENKCYLPGRSDLFTKTVYAVGGTVKTYSLV